LALINFEISNIFSAGNERMDSAAKLTSEDWHLDANCANFEHHRDFFTKIYEINQVSFEFVQGANKCSILSGTFTTTK